MLSDHVVETRKGSDIHVKYIGHEIFLPAQNVMGVVSDVSRRFGRLTVYLGGQIVRVKRNERIIV